MKSKEEIEEYLGMKIEPYYITEAESIYGEEQIAYDRYVFGQRIPANYKIRGETLPKRTEEVLKKLIKESVLKKDMETALTCYSILSKYTINSLEELNANQISELMQYQRDEEQKRNEEIEEGRKNWHEFQAKRKAEQEAKEKAEEQARIKAEQEAKERVEEQARIQAEKEAQAKAEEKARIQAEKEAQTKNEEEARIQAEQEAKARAEEEARIQAEQEAKARAEEEARIQAEQEAKEKERQDLIDKDIDEYEQYEELITRKPELDKLLDELKYEDFSAEIHGHTSERMQKLLNNMKMLPEDERKIIVQQYNKHANLLINEHGEFLRDEKIADSLQPKEEIKTNQIVSEVRENELSSSEEKAIETSIEPETSVEIDDNSMMEAHLEYMRNHQTQQTSKVVEDYWNEIHSQNAKLYEQQQPEKVKPREESIRDEVGDKKDIESNMQMQERQPSTVDLWTNRFSNYYSAIDRVSQNVKAKFVEMKSNIIKAISEKLTERTSHRQVNMQKQDTNER